MSPLVEAATRDNNGLELWDGSETKTITRLGYPLESDHDPGEKVFTSP
jgi:hypothetical protein